MCKKLTHLGMGPQGTAVTLKLRMGRWRCRTPVCRCQIFTERVAGVLVPYAQHTNRLAETGTLVGRALGGRPAERLLNRLGMPVSRHTLLRRVKRAARNAVLPEVRVVGVDDWAWSKGKSLASFWSIWSAAKW
jgi:hypothetical protein